MKLLYSFTCRFLDCSYIFIFNLFHHFIQIKWSVNLRFKCIKIYKILKFGKKLLRNIRNFSQLISYFTIDFANQLNFKKLYMIDASHSFPNTISTIRKYYVLIFFNRIYIIEVNLNKLKLMLIVKIL